jgi:uncharacterized damage-inducible protein DinB
MFRTVDDFTSAWDYERSATLKLFRTLTDTSLGQRVTHEGRSIQDLAWHMVLALPDMLRRVGLATVGPAEDAPAPEQAGPITDAYEEASREITDQVVGSWSDETLDDVVSIFGQEWKKGSVLASLLVHQAHHRGQLTVLMRQAGLTVRGIYGPAREEWAAMGRDPEP